MMIYIGVLPAKSGCDEFSQRGISLRVIRHLMRQREQDDDLTQSMPSLADRTDHPLARQSERFPYLLNIARVHFLAELPRSI